MLCDHEAATDALGSVLAVAQRQDGRCPEGEEERKSWLYALARWTCLRALTEQKRGRQATGGRPPRLRRPVRAARPLRRLRPPRTKRFPGFRRVPGSGGAQA
ncbi:hypothetical protein NKH18_22950 [Streptomyces sp. M10(2022)]